MQVKRLPIDTGTAAWNALLPDTSPAVELCEDITADFVIIGGGFAGLSAARRLKQIDPAMIDTRLPVFVWDSEGAVFCESNNPPHLSEMQTDNASILLRARQVVQTNGLAKMAEIFRTCPGTNANWKT